jgi:hypothetical protein
MLEDFNKQQRFSKNLIARKATLERVTDDVVLTFGPGQRKDGVVHV